MLSLTIKNIKLCVIILNVTVRSIMLCVVMLSVIMPRVTAPIKKSETCTISADKCILN
jgi:hypothetical protein